MLEKHFTSNGNRMLIAEMSDAHLRNMVKLKIAKLGKLQNQMSENSAMSEFQARLYGVETVDVEVAARKSREIITSLYPYLAECYLRGLNDLAEPLRKVIGRNGQLMAVSDIFLPATTDTSNEDLNINQLLDSFDLDDSLFSIKKETD